MTKQGFNKDEFVKTLEVKAREVYAESRKLMKEGFHNLEIVANKAMDAGRIKIENQKALRQLRSLFSELGQRVYDAVLNQAHQAIKVTPEIATFIEQIKKLQKNVEQNINKLRHIPQAPAPKKAKAAKKKVAPKKGKKTKPASKKKK